MSRLTPAITPLSNAVTEQAQRAAAPAASQGGCATDRKRKADEKAPHPSAPITEAETSAAKEKVHEVARTFEQERLFHEVKRRAFLAFVESLKQQGLPLAEIKDGQAYYGPVIKISEDGLFAVQKVGRTDVVIHDLAKLNGDYKGGQYCEIRYRHGLGTDKQQEQGHSTRTKGLER